MLENEYDFYLADTDAGKSIHYSLRYQVYCLRERYEDPTSHPESLEQDEYDEVSAHFIARCRNTGEWLGAMRLVVGSVHNLPLTRYATVDLQNSPGIKLTRVAEASRLCTWLPTNQRADFTPRPVNRLVCRTGTGAPTSRALHASAITIGLIRASRRYSLQHGIVNCLFLITDSFARLLRRLGMEIEPVGSPCQHRGWRRPYLHNFVTGYQEMATRSPDLYNTFCQGNVYSRYSEIEENPDCSRVAAMG